MRKDLSRRREFAGPGRVGAGLLVALFLSALALRPQIVGVGPLVPEIQDDLGISHAVAGLLGTIPVLCMGLFAPPAPWLLGRVGSRAAIGAAIALIGIAGVARALVPGALGVILLTFPVGIGIGLAGALMPVAVKERFPGRPALATGIYTAGINTGAAIAAAVAVPLAAATAGWRDSLLVLSVAAAGLAAVWLVQTRGGPAHLRTGIRPPHLPLGSRVAWTLVAMFALLATGYYGLNSWLPDSYQERGWGEDSAGALLAVLNVASIFGGLLIAWLADRTGSRRLWLVTSSAVQVGSIAGVILLPGGGWVWAAVFGAANGGLFALVMTLPLDVAEGPAQVGAVAALMLGAGYCLGALSPLALGAIRDASGTFTSALWVVAGTATLFLALSATLTPERLHRGVTVAYRTGRATSS
jgi:CP family cyanate transporter-like MFS transporter